MVRIASAALFISAVLASLQASALGADVRVQGSEDAIRVEARDATGTEILGELASLPATAAIPVVVLSSDADDVIAQLVANGAIEAVPKPFDIHQFIAMLDRYFP